MREQTCKKLTCEIRVDFFFVKIAEIEEDSNICPEIQGLVLPESKTSHVGFKLSKASSSPP
jgi:hypothetical protein